MAAYKVKGNCHWVLFCLINFYILFDEALSQATHHENSTSVITNDQTSVSNIPTNVQFPNNSSITTTQTFVTSFNSTGSTHSNLTSATKNPSETTTFKSSFDTSFNSTESTPTNVQFHNNISTTTTQTFVTSFNSTESTHSNLTSATKNPSETTTHATTFKSSFGTSFYSPESTQTSTTLGGSLASTSLSTATTTKNYNILGCNDSIQFPFKIFKLLNYIWMIQVEKNNHLDIIFSQLELSGKQASLFVGPGTNFQLNAGVLLTKPRTIRVAQPEAFVRLSNANGKIIHFYIQCSKYRQEGIIMNPIPTDYKPLDSDVTVDSCLMNLDNSTVQQFLKGGSLLQQTFENKISNKSLEKLSSDTSCWNSHQDEIVTHIHWPIFVEAYNNYTRFKVCFHVTVKISSAKNCSLSKEKNDSFVFVAIGIFITGLTATLFTVIWYQQRKEFNKSMELKKQMKAEMPVEMWPKIQDNPLLGLDLGHYNDAFENENILFQPNWSEEMVQPIDDEQNLINHTDSPEIPDQQQQSDETATNFSTAFAYSGNLKPKITTTNIAPSPKLSRVPSNAVQFKPVVDCLIFDTNEDVETQL